MGAPSALRWLRFARSFILPVAAIGGLVFLLTAYLVLYQPLAGPEHVQRLGWQSWSLINPPEVLSPGIGGAHSGGAINDGSGSGGGGVDWWNVSQPDATKVDSANFPLDVWNPLLPHDTGLTEITVVGCALPPSLAWGNLCKPQTTKEQDATKGKWVRVEGNVNAVSSVYNLHLWYRRTRRLDIPLITALLILPDGAEPPNNSPAWHRVGVSLRHGVLRVQPLYLWYRAEHTRRELTDAQARTDLVTELDLLYGADVPWPGFELLEPATTEEQPGRTEMVHVAYRKGVKPIQKAPPLHFSHTGRYKILQVADLHFSVARGTCRDTPEPCSDADNRTQTLLARVLDAERPDLVVFTGDQLNGQGTSWDARSVLAKFAREVLKREIPWAAVFGNHDAEEAAPREEQARMLQALPLSLVQPGPADIHGVGNYVLRVKSADPSMTHLLTLYFLDSGAYANDYLGWFGVRSNEYDWIRTDQIDWFLQESAAIDPIIRPFTPDGSKDLSESWHSQGVGQVTGTQSRLAKPNAMVFFHIPLQETYAKADIDPRTGKPLDVGLQLEGNDAAKESAGFFDKGLRVALESEHVAAGGAREVKVVANGHSHICENCKRVKGIWLCFGGGGSYSGYGKVGFDRRFRIYDISDFGETIVTYKRTERGEIIDEMVLSGKGAPPPYEETH